MASGSGLEIQEEGYQSFSNDQAIDLWLQRKLKKLTKFTLRTHIAQRYHRAHRIHRTHRTQRHHRNPNRPTDRQTDGQELASLHGRSLLGPAQIFFAIKSCVSVLRCCYISVVVLLPVSLDDVNITVLCALSHSFSENLTLILIYL